MTCPNLRYTPDMGGTSYCSLNGEMTAEARSFLAASVAVWREIDSIYAKGTYEGIGGSTALRVAEREAWEAYRRTLDNSGPIKMAVVSDEPWRQADGQPIPMVDS